MAPALSGVCGGDPLCGGEPVINTSVCIRYQRRSEPLPPAGRVFSYHGVCFVYNEPQQEMLA